MLHNLQGIFGSAIKALEIFYVLEDVKPVARIMVNGSEKEKIFGFLEEKRLCYALSDFKILKDDKDKAYSDKGVKVSADSVEKGYFFVYISKDKEKADKAKEFEKDGKHKEFGVLLGYPECCGEFFEKHFEEESKRHNDFTLATLKDSDGFTFPFYTNIASRHFDVALLSHFPCSFTCSDSIESAKKHLGIIKKYDKEAAEIIEGMLKGGIVYTETNGVFLLRYPILEHNRLYYKGIMASKNNQLYESLKNADYIEIVNKNRIRLSGLEIKYIGIMLFS